MKRLLLLTLLLGLSACRSQQQETAEAQTLQAQVLDGGVVAEGAAPQVEDWSVKGRVVPTQTRIGDPFLYELTFTHAKDQRFELVQPKELEQFEVLEQSRQRQDGQGGSVTTFTLKMSAFELGMLTLPQLTFDLTAPSVSQSVAVPGMQVEVLPVLPKDADEQGASLFDFQPPAEVPIRSWRLLYILAGVLAAGLLAWGLVKWLRRPRPQVVAVKPLAPLDVRTRKALDALKREELPAKGHVKDFYFRLSEILRGYLGERYGFEALECTTPELIASLRKLRTPGLPEEPLMRFISESDMVKYAKAEASPESCAQSLAFGYELVEKTYVPPAPVPAQPPPHAPGPRV
ncbi:BatD family protein [Hyalangium sp.]|uniref:BatD family protein n=1 Tax=Hyalangium sp. TaxID=2028555 RepID=UPI002D598EF5|nr:BatD family protein [Hyalangium sp.]HYI02850.1 BatD family protein [Hyalangium sp.]